MTKLHRLPPIVTALALLSPSFCGAQPAPGSLPDADNAEQVRANARAAREGAIAEGRGSTTNAGKFVATDASPETHKRPVNREAAEQQLRRTLNVEDLGGGKFGVGKVIFDTASRTIKLPAKVNMRSGVIEYALTAETGKAHEAMLTTKARPQDLHLACLLLGMNPSPMTGEPGKAMPVPPSQSVKISVVWETNGPVKTVPLAGLLGLAMGGPGKEASPMTDGPWSYTGSRFSGNGQFEAEAEGSFISLIRDDAALLNSPDPARDNDEVHVPNTTALPATGFPVTVVLQLPSTP